MFFLQILCCEIYILEFGILYKNFKTTVDQEYLDCFSLRDLLEYNLTCQISDICGVIVLLIITNLNLPPHPSSVFSARTCSIFFLGV
jgi:hypothetical protein